MNIKLSFGLQKAIISHFNIKSTFYKSAKQYTIYDQSLKAIKKRESRVYKLYIDANKINTPIFATTLMTIITTTLPTTTSCINTF